MAERSEMATGTQNTIYNLASVLYHTLDAGASYDRYVRDAEEAGDQELAEFFRVLRDEDSRRADYAQELLARRTPTGGGARTEDVATEREGMAAGVPPSPEPAGAAPGAGYVPPTEPRQEVPPTRPGTEGHVVPPRDEEAPPSGQREGLTRVSEREQRGEEDKGLLDEVRDRLLGTPEERRSEGTDRPPDRR
jgi:hypothetical protein